MWATAYTVETHQALGFAPRRSADRIIAALTIQQAPVAFVATRRILVQPQNRPARYCAEQRAQRANRTAPQPCNAQARRPGDEKQNPPDPTPRQKPPGGN